MDAETQGAAQDETSDDEPSDLEPGDCSSSLSDAEDKENEQETKAETSDDLSDPIDDNESEAETERLEDYRHSPHTRRDVILGSNNQGQTHERDLSEVHDQNMPERGTGTGQEEAEDNSSQSEEDLPVREALEDKRSISPESRTVIEYIKESLENDFNLPPPPENTNKKRKRSIMAGSGLDDMTEEPLRKRTGSIITSGDKFAIRSGALHGAIYEEGEQPNLESGNFSDKEGNKESQGPRQDDIIIMDGVNIETHVVSPSLKAEARQHTPNENRMQDHQYEGLNTQAEVNGVMEVDNVEDTEDNVDSAQRSEEEQKTKCIALEKLSTIETNFAAFRERYYKERLEQLAQEEAMLRQSKPTHPGYIAMMKCIDERRDKRYRIADQILDYSLETLKISAKATRSQILTQYQQEVRSIRETFIERLGKEWYDIQHDRRTFAGSLENYGLRFPAKRSEQIRQQVAYNNEVSILSGVAKYVGFPAAPPMAQATNAEFENDMLKMGRTRHHAHLAAAQPLQDIATMRTIRPSHRLKPSEEQFLEQTPWANAQHPSHSNALQPQASTQQEPQGNSPFTQGPSQSRQYSHQPGFATPISGTFSTNAPLIPHRNGIQPSGRASPQNPFSKISHVVVPSPLRSRHFSNAPYQTS